MPWSSPAPALLVLAHEPPDRGEDDDDDQRTIAQIGKPLERGRADGAGRDWRPRSRQLAAGPRRSRPPRGAGSRRGRCCRGRPAARSRRAPATSRAEAPPRSRTSDSLSIARIEDGSDQLEGSCWPIAPTAAWRPRRSAIGPRPCGAPANWLSAPARLGRPRAAEQAAEQIRALARATGVAAADRAGEFGQKIRVGVRHGVGQLLGASGRGRRRRRGRRGGSGSPQRRASARALR